MTHWDEYQIHYTVDCGRCGDVLKLLNSSIVCYHKQDVTKESIDAESNMYRNLVQDSNARMDVVECEQRMRW